MSTNQEGSDPQSYAVIGAAMEVHRELRNGFSESIYQDALAVEFNLRLIPFERERTLGVRYKGEALATRFRADFVCYADILIECKALKALSGEETAQILNYLRVTGFRRALLFNFGRPSLEMRRFVLDSVQVVGAG
jgi:GxxExxY protein